MSDTPKFEVIDRRKFKAEEEHERETPAQGTGPAGEAKAAVPEAGAPGTGTGTGLGSGTAAGPRLVVNESRSSVEAPPAAMQEGALEEGALEEDLAAELPLPTAQESQQLKAAYEASSQRLEDLVRAQNPGVGAQPPVTFQHLVQQFYMSAMIQMGAGTQEGQRPRVDILGAKGTIDLLGVLSEKTKGNLSDAEDRALQTVLFEVRMAFNELTSMINLQAMQPPPPPPGKR
jgi:Domain of unknown function (DUF1844)